MPSYYKQALNDWVSSLDVKADTVLDIGGAQNPIKGRTRSWDVKWYKIMDLAVPHSNAPGPDIVQDMNNPISLTHLWGSADLIFMLGVMDYVIRPNVALENVAFLLADSGTAWVEFPFVYPIHNPVDDEGCRYSEGCIRRLAKAAKLSIEDLIYKRPKPGNSHLLQFYAEDGMRMAKGVDHNVTGYIVKFRHDI